VECAHNYRLGRASLPATSSVSPCAWRTADPARQQPRDATRPRSGAEPRTASPALQSLVPSAGAGLDRRAAPSRDRIERISLASEKWDISGRGRGSDSKKWHFWEESQ
jgi:hypothetical protein